MNCPKCADKHPGIIPEEVFTCNCSCHSWASPSTSVQIDGISDGLHLTTKELKALSRALERQYLPYDDEELHEVVNKIFKALRETS